MSTKRSGPARMRLHPDELPHLGVRAPINAAPVMTDEAPPAPVATRCGFVASGRTVSVNVPGAPRKLVGWQRDTGTPVYRPEMRLLGPGEPIEIEEAEFLRLEGLGYVVVEKPTPPPAPDAPQTVNATLPGRVAPSRV